MGVIYCSSTKGIESRIVTEHTVVKSNGHTVTTSSGFIGAHKVTGHWGMFVLHGKELGEWE